MNTVPQPRERTPLETGEVRYITIGHEIDQMIITEHSVSIPDEDGWIHLVDDEAIEAAKAIILAYNVPFKNAVKGAGLEV